VTSYRRKCRYCGQTISMRQMPHGQWVAFGLTSDVAHNCRSGAVPPSPTPKPPQSPLQPRPKPQPHTATGGGSIFDGLEMPTIDIVSGPVRPGNEVPPATPPPHPPVKPAPPEPTTVKPAPPTATPGVSVGAGHEPSPQPGATATTGAGASKSGPGYTNVSTSGSSPHSHTRLWWLLGAVAFAFVSWWLFFRPPVVGPGANPTRPPRAVVTSVPIPTSTAIPKPTRAPTATARPTQVTGGLPDENGSTLPRITPTVKAAAIDRRGCDPAYPELRTCIPPGPPLEWPCSITAERNFTVLPPDPRGLDHDGDGIGCEPIVSD
jgi:hypothetical protein